MGVSYERAQRKGVVEEFKAVSITDAFADLVTETLTTPRAVADTEPPAAPEGTEGAHVWGAAASVGAAPSGDARTPRGTAAPSSAADVVTSARRSSASGGSVSVTGGGGAADPFGAGAFDPFGAAGFEPGDAAVGSVGSETRHYTTYTLNPKP